MRDTIRTCTYHCIDFRSQDPAAPLGSFNFIYCSILLAFPYYNIVIPLHAYIVAIIIIIIPRDILIIFLYFILARSVDVWRPLLQFCGNLQYAENTENRIPCRPLIIIYYNTHKTKIRPKIILYLPIIITIFDITRHDVVHNIHIKTSIIEKKFV